MSILKYLSSFDRNNQSTDALMSRLSLNVGRENGPARGLKGSLFLKNIHFFFIQEMSNKFINSVNTIIKCGI